MYIESRLMRVVNITDAGIRDTIEALSKHTYLHAWLIVRNLTYFATMLMYCGKVNRCYRLAADKNFRSFKYAISINKTNIICFNVIINLLWNKLAKEIT